MVAKHSSGDLLVARQTVPDVERFAYQLACHFGAETTNARNITMKRIATLQRGTSCPRVADALYGKEVGGRPLYLP